MAQIDGEIIKSAIALNIRQNITLDTPYKIYKEKIIQGMSKPCFFIWTLDVSQENRRAGNYDRYYQMNIRFHTADDVPKMYEKLCDIGNALLECLVKINVPVAVKNAEGQIVDVNKPVKGSQMSFTITDNVLQVFVTYRIKASTPPLQVAKMNVLDIE